MTVADVSPRERRDAGASRRQAGALDALLALTESDLRARYGRGPWRLLKWLLDPFAVVGIYLVLVTVVLERGGHAPGLALACAVVPFSLVMTTIVNALNSVSNRSSIILNMAFERVLIPISSALTETIAFGASLVLVVLMMAIYAIAPTFAVVWLPVVIALNVLLAIGCAYGAALVGLWFPDLRPFAVSFARTLFFLAPGLVPLSAVGGRANDLLRINPLTGLFEAYRSILVAGHRPAAWQLLIPLAAAAVLLAAFVPVFARDQREFAKVV